MTQKEIEELIGVIVITAVLTVMTVLVLIWGGN